MRAKHFFANAASKALALAAAVVMMSAAFTSCSKDNDDDNDDDSFDDDKFIEESYRTTFDATPEDLDIQAEDITDDDF